MYTYRWGVRIAPTVADTDMTKVGRGPNSRMKDALMKLEPEVVVDPRGTTANLSLPQPSLDT